MKKDNIKKFIEKSKIPILIIILFILFAYGERLISNSFSIDTEYYINDYIKNFTWWNGLSRWGLVLINKIFQIGPLVIYQSNLFMCLFILLGSILFNYLIYLHIDKKQEENFLKYQFIFPIIFYTTPIFAEQFNFINQNFAVSLGIAMVPFSLILFYYGDKEKNKMKKIILNIIGMSITIVIFGIYQSIILLFVATVAILYLLKCLQEKDNNFRYLLIQIGRFAICALVYLLIGKISGSGNTYLQSGYSDGIAVVLRNIYYVLISSLKCETIYYNISFLLAIVLAFILLIIFIKDKKINIGVILGGIGVLLAPYYIMMVTGVDQLKRTQFNYSFIIGFIIFLFIITIMNYKKFKKIGYIMVVIAIAIAYKQSLTTATLFASDNVRYQHDIEVAEKIMYRLEEKDWYNKNKKYTLVLLGKDSCETTTMYLRGEVIGASFFEFDYQYNYGVSQRANHFLKTLGYYFEEPTSEEFDKAKEYVKEKNIKSMPSSNSIIQLEDNIIVVRLSDEI